MEFLLDHLPPAAAPRAGQPQRPAAAARPAAGARASWPSCARRDLRFTAEEAAQLLRADGRGATSRPPSSRRWASAPRAGPPGLQLAALSLRGRADVTGFVAEFSGSHRFVLDYLTEEVLERQPGELRTFLLETSVLDRLSGPLCDAVVGRPDSQQLLESVERASLFLIPLDEERRWWRYHHLFADLLRANLQAEHPHRVPELHRAAAEWYGEHGLPDDAIRHALAGGDTDRAAELVEEHLEEQVWRRAQGATIAAWLAALPSEEIHRRPLLTLGQAVAALMAGRLDAVEPLLDVAERALERTPAAPYRASLDRRFSVLANIPAGIAVCRADLARMRGDVDGRAGVRPCRARPRHRAGRAARRGRALPGGVRRFARGPGGGRRARAGGRLRRAGRVRAARPRAARRVRPRRRPARPGAPPRCAAHLRARAAGHRRAIDRRRPRACCTSGSPRCTSNATSWPTRTGWSPRASSSAAGSRTSPP